MVDITNDRPFSSAFFFRGYFFHSQQWQGKIYKKKRMRWDGSPREKISFFESCVMEGCNSLSTV